MSDDEMTTGGCQCGAVRYRFAGRTSNPSICHCRMCQKAFGSYFAPLGGVARNKIEWTSGRPAIFRSSSVAERGFCDSCGTPLTFAYDASDEINIALGSLDHPELEIPVNAYGSESEMPWFDWLPQLATHPTDPNSDHLAGSKNFQHPDHDTDNWPKSS